MSALDSGRPREMVALVFDPAEAEKSADVIEQLVNVLVPRGVLRLRVTEPDLRMLAAMDAANEGDRSMPAEAWCAVRDALAQRYPNWPSSGGAAGGAA